MAVSGKLIFPFSFILFTIYSQSSIVNSIPKFRISLSHPANGICNFVSPAVAFLIIAFCISENPELIISLFLL
jgi:hypothetical protein